MEKIIIQDPIKMLDSSYSQIVKELEAEIERMQEKIIELEELLCQNSY